MIYALSSSENSKEFWTTISSFRNNSPNIKSLAVKEQENFNSTLYLPEVLLMCILNIFKQTNYHAGHVQSS